MGKSALQLRMEKMRNNSNKATATTTTTTHTTPEPKTKKEVKTSGNSDPRPQAPWAENTPACRFCAKSPVKGVFEGRAENVCPICKVKGKKDNGIDADDYIVDITENLITIYTADGEEVLSSEEVVEVSSKEKTSSIVEAESKEAEKKAEADRLLAQAEAEAKELQDKADAELKAQEEAEAVAKAEATAKVETEPEVVKEHLKELAPTQEDTATAPTEDLEFTNERGRGKLLIGCAIIETAGTGNGKLGSPSLIISGTQLKLMVTKYLMNTKEVREEVFKKGVVCWEDLNSFNRKDLISAYGKVIAEKLGSSTIQVRHVPRASDLEAIIESISPYMTVIAALAI